MFINMFRSYDSANIDDAIDVKMMSDNRIEIVIGDETLTEEQVNSTDKINILIDINAILYSRGIKLDSNKKVTVRYKDKLRINLDRIGKITLYNTEPTNEIVFDMTSYMLVVDIHDSTYLRVRSYFHKAVIKAVNIVICGLKNEDMGKHNESILKVTKQNSDIYIHRDILALCAYTNNCVMGYSTVKYDINKSHIKTDNNTYIYSDGMVFDVKEMEVYPLNKNPNLIEFVKLYIPLVI